MNMKIFGITFFLVGVLFFTGAGCSKNPIKTDKPVSNKNNTNFHSAAPIEDRGEIEATVTDIYQTNNSQIDYGKIRVDKIIKYEHHPNADYTALAVGDEVDVYFQWGAQAIIIETSPDNINLPGVIIGNKIRVNIQGPMNSGGDDITWTLHEYSIIK